MPPGPLPQCGLFRRSARPRPPGPKILTVEPDPEALQRYRNGWRRRRAARAAALSARQARAWQVARQAGRLLREAYGARTVWVFGSLARGCLDEASDIDLAAAGLPEAVYFRAVGELQALDPDFPVDLVRVEDAPEPLRKRVEAEGVEV